MSAGENHHTIPHVEARFQPEALATTAETLDVPGVRRRAFVSPPLDPKSLVAAALDALSDAVLGRDRAAVQDLSPNLPEFALDRLRETGFNDLENRSLTGSQGTKKAGG